MSYYHLDDPAAVMDAQPPVTMDGGAPDPLARKVKMKVKLNLKSLTGLALIQRGKDIKAAMTGNAHFTTPNPPLATVQGLVTAAETAVADYDASAGDCAMKLTLRDAAVQALAAGLTNLGAYVQNVSGGDEAIIHSAGMDVRALPAPIGPLPQAGSLSATMDDNEGQINLAWDPVRGADNYTVQQHADPLAGNGNGGWAFVGTAPRAHFAVPGLNSGTKYWFRVAANGSAGTGPWSDAAGKMAP